MATGDRSGARWIVLLLGVALVASAAVVYALVQITTPGNGTTGPPTETSADTTLASSTGGVDGPSGPSGGTTHPSGSGTPHSAASTTVSTPAPPPPTTTSALPGSAVTVPASWSGVAKVTLTVLGECATPTPSVYTDLPADLALDLIQNEASAAEVPVPPSVRPTAPTLTLGINASGVPALALYTSQIDQSGQLQQYWRLHITPDDAGTSDRSDIAGTLVNPAQDGTNPNIIVDAETSLQPCESAGTVSLPRVLAQGSHLSGWVSAAHAELTLRATTTDHKREVTVEITADRTH